MIRNRDTRASVTAKIDGILDEWGGIINEPAPTTWGGVRTRLNKVEAYNSLPAIAAKDSGSSAREKINALLSLENYRKLDLDFVNDQFLLIGPGGASGRIADFVNFSRASDATYFDASGAMQTAASNEWRLDHDPATGEALGYRAEGGGTNLMPWSSDLSQAIWSMTNWTATPGQPSFKPGEAATLLTSLGGNGNVRTNNIAIPGSAVTASVYVRKVTGPTDANQFAARNASRGETWNIVNLNYDTLATTNAGGVKIATTEFLARRLADEWAQIAFRNSADISAAENFWLYLLAAGNTVPADQAALAFGAHIRTGAVLDSYIPTAGAAATRAADNLSHAIPVATEGTVAIRARTALGRGAQQVLWQADAGNSTSSNRVVIARSSNGEIICLVNYDGVDVVTLDLGSAADGLEIDVAFSWMQGRFAASLNGGEPVVETSYTGPVPALSRGFAGGVNGDSAWFGTIARTTLLDHALSPEQLQDIAP